MEIYCTYSIISVGPGGIGGDEVGGQGRCVRDGEQWRKHLYSIEKWKIQRRRAELIEKKTCSSLFSLSCVLVILFFFYYSALFCCTICTGKYSTSICIYYAMQHK